MKLIVDRKVMQENIRVAESFVGSATIALMFKDFYSDFYDNRFEEYVCYGNKVNAIHRVTNHISNEEEAYGKILIHEDAIARHIEHSKIYIPINLYDNREGLSIDDTYNIVKKFKRYKDKITLLITSGCINDRCPTYEEIAYVWGMMKDLVSGISVGGSFYLVRDIPEFITEVRIGEYMILGTIPFASDKSRFSDSAIEVETEVIASYPERGHILVNGGWATIDTHKCTMLSKDLEFVHNSCDYTIYSDKYNRYSKGDIVSMIPDYNSLVKMQNVAREYKK